ncbi:hypothetical protein [Herpetosiphon giganteus]|uniref:hypothetical protein n=1 Tax=Herpetosiphon giganteus TaxID=2029754 RepID=UPI001EF7F64E|nr:hypothetical protein [Herpetosiphon giganteus]MBM7845176.1 hypothetical protein [Herpetosiphon giganteus]
MHTLLTTTIESIVAAQQYDKRPDRATFCPSTLVQTLVYGIWPSQPPRSNSWPRWPAALMIKKDAVQADT